MSRKTLPGILDGRAGISPEMAVRLSIAFDTTAESWLSQQLQYDLWHAERNKKRPRREIDRSLIASGTMVVWRATFVMRHVYGRLVTRHI